jgi:hypothetical protein
MTLVVQANRDVHVLEDERALTLMCHRGDVALAVLNEDIAEIGPTDTLLRVAKLTAEDWRSLATEPMFMTPFKKVFTDMELVADDGFGTIPASLGVKHVAGMIILMFEAMAANKRPFIRLPESYLHPRHQGGLADMLIWFSGIEKS